jgi:hypothetical protein
MDAFHTKKALEMYKRLPESKPESIHLLKDIVPDDSPTQIAFRKLRAELEEEGWFERDLLQEAKLLGIWASLVVSAALTAHSIPVLSTVLLGLSMTNAGWLGHDYVHGVDDFSIKMRNFAAVAAGLDPIWWSDKHNKHHALSKYSISHDLLLAYTTALHSLSLHKQPTKWEWMRILRPIRFSINGHPHPKMIRHYERFNI